MNLANIVATYYNPVVKYVPQMDREINEIHPVAWKYEISNWELQFISQINQRYTVLNTTRL